MAERLKAHAWSACVRESVPWVQIPLSPLLVGGNKTFFHPARKQGHVIEREYEAFNPNSES